MLLARLHPGQPRRLGGHGPALPLHALDGVDVVGHHALERVHALQQVGEAVRAEDHRDDVGPVGLVLGHQLGGQDLAVLDELRPQRRQPGAALAQLALDSLQLGLLDVQAGLDGGQPGTQVVDSALEAADRRRLRLDRRLQPALARLGRVQAVLQLVRRGPGGRRPGREHNADQPAQHGQPRERSRAAPTPQASHS